jgi:hypothetical protein
MVLGRVVSVWLPGYFNTSRRASNVPDLALRSPASAVLKHCFLFNPAVYRPEHSHQAAEALVGIAGLVLDLAGVAFAIWARSTLGRNWSRYGGTDTSWCKQVPMQSSDARIPHYAAWIPGGRLRCR